MEKILDISGLSYYDGKIKSWFTEKLSALGSVYATKQELSAVSSSLQSITNAEIDGLFTTSQDNQGSQEGE